LNQLINLNRFVDPVEMARPRGAHRLECFSPKLERRLRLYNRPPFETWLKLESDPTVIRFCERPGHLHESKHRRVIDFWVCYRTYEEFWLIDLGSDPAVRSEPRYVSLSGDEQAPVRLIRFTDIMAWQTLTRNWERMLPYVNAARGHISSRLCDDVLEFLSGPRQLSSIESALRPVDSMLVRGALFSLVLQGRAIAPSLFDKPLSSQTRFSLSEAAL
jgi:hypothetical protein